MCNKMMSRSVLCVLALVVNSATAFAPLSSKSLCRPTAALKSSFVGDVSQKSAAPAALKRQNLQVGRGPLRLLSTVARSKPASLKASVHV